jgi:membrane fusion protein (multidrug efflux system)
LLERIIILTLAASNLVYCTNIRFNINYNETDKMKAAQNRGPFLTSGESFIGFALLVAVTLTVACQEQEAGGGFSMPPMAVEVAPVAVRSIADKFEAVGGIEAIEAITVVSEIDAAVVALPFEEGASIKRGDLIAQLDDSQLSAEVARAKAVVAQSQASYDRVRTVVQQNAGAPQDLDDAAATLKVAEANLAVAMARFAKTRIVAPFSGIIGARRMSVGSFIRAGQPITELANIDSIRVIFSAPERLLSELERGAEVVVSTTAYADHQVGGKIIVINPILDSATRSAQIVASLPNPGRKFRAGMSANISAVLSERPEAITIPSESVFASGDQSFVYTVQTDSTVNRIAISLGTRTTDVVEVVSGLEPGMRVVKAGHQKLFQGAKVMPVTPDDPTASTGSN